MADDSPDQDPDRFQLRLPAGMRERVQQAARASGRSMNAQIVAYIGAGLDGVGIDVNHLAERIVDLAVERLAAGRRKRAPAKKR